MEHKKKQEQELAELEDEKQPQTGGGDPKDPKKPTNYWV